MDTMAAGSSVPSTLATDTHPKESGTQTMGKVLGRTHGACNGELTPENILLGHA